MNRARSILGLVASLFLVLSSGAHSLLGWPQLRAGLEQAHAPADLVTGLALGWHFAGVAILTFGILGALTFGGILRGRAMALWPVQLIGAVYLLFGIGALVVSHFDLFFLIFVIPGVLLLAASLGGRSPAAS
jgi:hypothetical protein